MAPTITQNLLNSSSSKIPSLCVSYRLCLVMGAEFEGIGFSFVFFFVPEAFFLPLHIRLLGKGERDKKDETQAAIRHSKAASDTPNFEEYSENSRRFSVTVALVP